MNKSVEKRMLKNWSKITGLTNLKIHNALVETELTRGQLKAWKLKKIDRSDTDHWMPINIVQSTWQTIPKLIIYYTNVVVDTTISLSLTVVGGHCEITEWNGLDYTITPAK